MSQSFYSAQEAAQYANTICPTWINESGDIIDYAAMMGIMQACDNDNPCGPHDPTRFHIVGDKGEIGFTSDGGHTVYWAFTPYYPQVAPAPMAPQPMEASPQYMQNSQAVSNMPGVGYSNVINSPEFQNAVNKNKKSQKGCAIAFILAPLVIFPIYTHFSDDLDLKYGLAIGAGLTVLLFICYQIFTIKSRIEKPWDGVVVNKEKRQERRYRNNDDDSRERYEIIPHDIITIKRDDGKTHTIDEISTSMFSNAYAYFKIGDRVRYHARLGLSFPYEKYDKTHDNYIICAFCRRRMNMSMDHCSYCKQPLLK